MSNQNLTNKIIYSYLVSQKYKTSKANQDFSEIYNINPDEWILIYNSLHNSKISNKIKEFCYKIYHRYLPTKSLLYKMNIVDTPRCNLCQMYNQTTKHLFLDCFESKNLWFRLEDFVHKEYSITIDFTSKIKVFGLTTTSEHKNEMNRYIYGIKYYIFTATIQDKPLNFNEFIRNSTEYFSNACTFLSLL